MGTYLLFLRSDFLLAINEQSLYPRLDSLEAVTLRVPGSAIKRLRALVELLLDNTRCLVSPYQVIWHDGCIYGNLYAKLYFRVVDHMARNTATIGARNADYPIPRLRANSPTTTPEINFLPYNLFRQF